MSTAEWAELPLASFTVERSGGKMSDTGARLFTYMIEDTQTLQRYYSVFALLYGIIFAVLLVLILLSKRFRGFWPLLVVFGLYPFFIGRLVAVTANTVDRALKKMPGNMATPFQYSPSFEGSVYTLPPIVPPSQNVIRAINGLFIYGLSEGGSQQLTTSDLFVVVKFDGTSTWQKSSTNYSNCTNATYLSGVLTLTSAPSVSVTYQSTSVSESAWKTLWRSYLWSSPGLETILTGGGVFLFMYTPSSFITTLPGLRFELFLAKASNSSWPILLQISDLYGLYTKTISLVGIYNIWFLVQAPYSAAKSYVSSTAYQPQTGDTISINWRREYQAVTVTRNGNQVYFVDCFTETKTNFTTSSLTTTTINSNLISTYYDWKQLFRYGTNSFPEGCVYMFISTSTTSLPSVLQASQ